MALLPYISLFHLQNIHLNFKLFSCENIVTIEPTRFLTVCVIKVRVKYIFLVNFFYTKHRITVYCMSYSALPACCSTQEYYHSGVVKCPSSESVSELRETCDYLMIPFDEKTIKTSNICEYSAPCGLKHEGTPFCAYLLSLVSCSHLCTHF